MPAITRALRPSWSATRSLIDRFLVARHCRPPIERLCALCPPDGSWQARVGWASTAARRYLEPGARLGVHRYGQRSPPVGIFLDFKVEQTRDRALVRRRPIAELFLARVEANLQEAMWLSTTAALIAAGVVEPVCRPR